MKPKSLVQGLLYVVANDGIIIRDGGIVKYESQAEEVKAYARALIARDRECDVTDVEEGVVDSLIKIAADGDPSTLDDLSPSARDIVDEISYHIDLLDAERDGK